MGLGRAGGNPRKQGCRRELFENILIVTDGEKTETNYFQGLKNSFPEAVRNKISIKILDKLNTQELVRRALKAQREDPREREIWIVFDKDNRPDDVDRIISSAKKHSINVAWSNPCIEIFFHAYYGRMPNNTDAKQCISAFSTDFQKATKKEYSKNDKDIYSLLCHSGDEKRALELSKNKLEQSMNQAKIRKPSAYCPGSTLHNIVSKITSHRPKNK